MEYLIYSLIGAIILTVGLNSILKKQSKLFYGLAIIISIIVTWYELIKINTGFKLDGILYVIERSFMKGYVATALFILVMFAGALNKRWGITKKLLRARAEMAIMASILIIPHCVIYLYKFLLNLLRGNQLSVAYIALVVLGTIAFIIMIPLFITSFRKVRIKMTPSKWNKVQKWAYPFYILVYLHIMIILLNKKTISWDSIIVYTIIFGAYLIFKVYNNRKK